MPADNPIDHCPATVQQDFERLFDWAKAKGVVDAEARGHYAHRYAVDAYTLRNELEMATAATAPTPTLPDDPHAYPDHLLTNAERRHIESAKAGAPIGTFGTFG